MLWLLRSDSIKSFHSKYQCNESLKENLGCSYGILLNMSPRNRLGTNKLIRISYTKYNKKFLNNLIDFSETKNIYIDGIFSFKIKTNENTYFHPEI